jgi:hypothetical protein
MVEIRFPEDQLAQALEAVTRKPPKEPVWTPRSALSLLQTVIVLAAAGWALWLSLRFDLNEKKIAEQQQELTKKSLELGNVIKGLAIKAAGEGRFTGSVSLSVRPRIDGKLFDATFKLRLVNTASRKIEVSWVLLRWFHGHDIKTKVAGFQWINPPPATGRVVWTLVDHKGFFYPGSHVAESLAKVSPQWHLDQGGPTKVLLPGDSAGFEEGFEIAKSPEHRVAFIATLGIDGQIWGDNLFEYVRLCDLDSIANTCDDPSTRTPGQ